MFKFVIILLVAVLARVFEAAVPDSRIVGGQPVNIAAHPYQISVQYYSQHICGGSALSTYAILTAAHCTEGKGASNLNIRYGSTYHNSGGAVVAVDEIIMHPSFNSSTSDYDVAILRLSGLISLGFFASTISLASRPFLNGEQLTVTGWGALSSDGPSTDNLYSADVQMITAAKCRTYDYPAEAITEQMICAASPGKDSCQGDSGGPLVSSGVQVGIVSWGHGCADARYPGVYTDVYKLRTWIVQTAGL